MLSPLPASGISIFATVWSWLTVTAIGRNIRPVAAAACSVLRIAACTAGVCTFAACTTTSAGVGAPGKAATAALYVFTIGSSRGMSVKLGSFVCMPRTGVAAATRSPPARTSESTGRRSTRSRTKPQKRDSPAACFFLPTSGIRPRSTRSPSFASIAGRTVTDPMTAERTTSIVPIAMPVKMRLPAMNSPAIAISTVAPEMSTACPDVEAARSSACRGSLPIARSSRSRRR